MKKYILTLLALGAAIFIGVGCASSQNLPSVTVGAGANKDAVLNFGITKKGINATAPLVDVNVPFPTVKEAK